jgi:hypothetical protein
MILADTPRIYLRKRFRCDVAEMGHIHCDAWHSNYPANSLAYPYATIFVLVFLMRDRVGIVDRIGVSSYIRAGTLTSPSVPPTKVRTNERMLLGSVTVGL